MGFKIKIVKTEQPLAKVDEIEILNQLAEAFIQHDGYSKDFLTEPLLTWVFGQIRMDRPPDLWAENHRNWQVAQEAETAQRTLTAEIERKSATLQRALDEITALDKKVEAFTQDQADYEDAREALANQEALAEELQRDKAKLVDELATAMLTQHKLEARLLGAEQTILRLKARLYDLEHREAAAPASEQDPLRFPYQQSA